MVVYRLSMLSNAQKLYDYLSLRDPLQEADAIFVLGAGSESPVRKSAELFLKGYSSHIIFVSNGGVSGGNIIWDMSEVKYYRRVLKEFSVPETALVYPKEEKNMTSNTLMEAKYSVPFMRERDLNPKKIILVSRPVHQRRAALTFKKQYPEIELINCPSEEPLVVELVPRMLGEIERLQLYSEKGDIVHEEIPEDILRAYGELKKRKLSFHY
ncbi:YdcF family protein [bacterium]|nr:MAG: YdcF family protein [bacterium]